MEQMFDVETQAIRQGVRRFVDEEFRLMIEDTVNRIANYHDLDPSHADVTDDFRLRSIDIPKEDKRQLRESAREMGTGRWASRRSTAAVARPLSSGGSF